MTNESKSLVSDSIEKKRMEFPIAIVETSEEAPWGIRGFPTSYLIGPDGIILWKGHPGAFEREFGEKRLLAVLENTSVLPSLPKAHKSIASLLEKEKYGEAWKKMTRALEHHPDDVDLKGLKDAMEAMTQRMQDEAAGRVEEGAFGCAAEIYDKLSTDFKGVPGCVEATEWLEALEDNPEAEEDLEARKKLGPAFAAWSKGDYEKALKTMKSVAKKYEETASGIWAQEMVDRHDDG
ncbi:MAG: hypothetical protein VX916_00750 [Planctomycetota bacterium]|nr:hypothetical protein [Planctomycetota bacterium]